MRAAAQKMVIAGAGGTVSSGPERPFLMNTSQNTERSLQEHIHAVTRAALESIPASDRADIYVISMYVSDIEDDHRRPTIMVGFNTEQRVAACTPAPGQKAKWPIASDAAEARWNFAFWLQNNLVTLGGDDDATGAALIQSWAIERGYWYSDEEEDHDFDAALAKVRPLTGAFVQLAVGVVQELHRSGELVRIFQRPVPVLIHELEYYDEIAAQNEDANPKELVEGFVEWVRSYK
ncbi:MAG: hypothetical protein JST54_35005 [Deltaproteobacteria bacterium]|nr:hypothetical protein [Deltaproteobacteria bacterium]